MTGLDELRRRYPWPATRPRLKPDWHGWLDGQMQRVLLQHLDRKTRCVVELGAWCGLSTRFILEHAPKATVICIDHWRGIPAHHDIPERAERLPRLYDTFIRNLWRWRRRVIPVRQTTVAGLRELYRLQVSPEVIYVDAGHDYDSVLADLVVASEFDCDIVGHDWDQDGVQQAVTRFAVARGLRIETLGKAWYLK